MNQALGGQSTRTARVCACIPDEANDHEVTADFDPEYDLALLWNMQGEPLLYILSMTDDSSLYWVSTGGLIIEGTDHRVLIGQDDAFMQSVAELQCALAQPRH